MILWAGFVRTASFVGSMLQYINDAQEYAIWEIVGFLIRIRMASQCSAKDVEVIFKHIYEIIIRGGICYEKIFGLLVSFLFAA